MASLPTPSENLPVREFYSKFRERLELKLVAGTEGLDRVIGEKSLNRPALALTGYFKFFAAKRIQLFGAGEMAYMRDLPEAEQVKNLAEMVRKNIPCIMISRNLAPTAPMVRIAEEHQVPLIRTTLKSKEFSTDATLLLEEEMAPRATLHGTLLDIKGIGTLIRGKSGVGKSECALALIERGYSLVADDITYVRLMGDREVVGQSSELNRGFMECRGLGIINVAELFGIRSVRIKKRVDLVVHFIEWKPGMQEERTGLESTYESILGVRIPLVEIPVRPGRDMARLVEVASMDQALKMIGHNSAQEFNERLISYMAKQLTNEE